MSKSKIIVRWDLQDPKKPRGESVVCEGVVSSCKIIFPERRWSGPLVHGALWECQVVHDTKPGDLDRGALIVQPLRPLTWGWINMGSPLWGVYERDLKCLEYPVLPDYLGPPRHMDYYLQRDVENKEWRQAKDKQALWNGGLWGKVDTFFAVFGEPSAVRPSGDQVVLVYPWGEKSVLGEVLISHWKCATTGQLRLRDEEIEVEFCFPAHPDCRFWCSLGSIGRPKEGLLPRTHTLFKTLDAAMQHQVLGLLRAFVVSPEDMAQICWQRRLARYDFDLVYGELAALHAPNAKIHTSRFTGQTYRPGSDDGFRPARHSNAWFIAYQLHVGGRQFSMGSVLEYDDPRVCDVETERCRLIQQHWDRISEALCCRLPEWPIHGEEIFGLNESTWTAQYRAAWTALADKLCREKAELASKLLRALQVEAEWEAFRQDSPAISMGPEATELPPIVVRDIGHQIVYGVAVIETAWSGAHAVWYRNEAEALVAHAASSEEFAARTAEQAAADAVHAARVETITPGHKAFAARAVAQEELPSEIAAPAIVEVTPVSASVADLKARFNRARQR